MGYQPITDLKEGVSERNCGKIVKSLNYLIAIGIIVVGGVQFFRALGLTTFFDIFRPIILIFMGLLLIAGDCQLGWLTTYFGFLRSTTGRGVYCLWLAALSALSGMGNNEHLLAWLGNILGIVLLANGLVLIMFGCVILLFYIISNFASPQQGKDEYKDAEYGKM